jgi:hypothetical protein
VLLVFSLANAFLLCPRYNNTKTRGISCCDILFIVLCHVVPFWQGEGGETLISYLVVLCGRRSV